MEKYTRTIINLRPGDARVFIVHVRGKISQNPSSHRSSCTNVKFSTKKKKIEKMYIILLYRNAITTIIY